MAVAATMPRMNEVTAAPAMMRFIGVLDCLRSVSSSVFVGIVLYSVMMPGVDVWCLRRSQLGGRRARRARAIREARRARDAE